MRKVWSRIFLLCMACMICMCGLCLAADDGNWIEYFRLDGYELFSVNPSSIKSHEWGGRKFLEANVRRDLINSNIGKGRIDNIIVIDIQNRKYIYLESGEWKDGKYLKFQSSSISEIVNGEELRSPSKYDVLVKWVEKNRPDVINEIHTHNQTAPSLESLRNAPPENSAPGTQAQPGGNVDVTGATNVPSGGSLEDIVGDIEYEVLDSGAVKFKIHNSYSAADSEYHDTYYIFAKPNEYKDYPGTYMTGAFFDDEPELIAHGFPSYFGHAFDYDPKTQTFIFYWWDFDDPKKSGYLYKTRLTGKNTAYEAEYRGFQLINEGAPKIGSETTYRYMPYDSLPWKVSEVQPDRHIVYMEGGQGGVLLPVSYFDDNKCVWYGEVRNYDHDEVTNYVTLDWQYFDLRADLMKAVLAVNGNIGQAFCPVFFTAR